MRKDFSVFCLFSDFLSYKEDKEVQKLIQAEAQRQSLGIELIASENYQSSAVLQAQASVFANKYAEGFP